MTEETSAEMPREKKGENHAYFKRKKNPFWSWSIEVSVGVWFCGKAEGGGGDSLEEGGG